MVRRKFEDQERYDRFRRTEKWHPLVSAMDKAGDDDSAAHDALYEVSEHRPDKVGFMDFLSNGSEHPVVLEYKEAQKAQDSAFEAACKLYRDEYGGPGSFSDDNPEHLAVTTKRETYRRYMDAHEDLWEFIEQNPEAGAK